MSRRSFVVVVLVSLFAALLLAACGGSSESEGETTAATTEAPADTGAAPAGETAEPAETGASEAPAETETLKVGIYPSVDYAALFVGLEAGIFEKHGLELEVQEILTGTGLFSAITSGATDLATNSVSAGVVAITNGLPIELVTLTTDQPIKGNTEILVKADSPIQTYKDLEGATVATINLQGLFHMGVLNAVQSEGGDPTTIEAVPMAPTDEPAALEAGRVDAIVLQEPFLTLAKEQHGFRSLGNPFATFDFEIPIGAFWTSTETAEAKADAIQRFKDAYAEATTYANENPELIKQVIPEYTDLTPEQVESITLPIYTTDLQEEPVLQMMQTMLGFEFLTYVPSYTQIVAGS